MKWLWPTKGVPMPCPACSAAYPCHFSSQREVSMPMNMPLTINTNIQYNLDKSKFPGLDSGNKELTLMIAPVSVVAPQTNTQCPAQTLVSTPLPSEDMQCSSGYVSEEDDGMCHDGQESGIPGIGSFLDFLNNGYTKPKKSSQKPKPFQPQRPFDPATQQTINQGQRHHFAGQTCGVPAFPNYPRTQLQVARTNSLPRTIPNHVHNFNLNPNGVLPAEALHPGSTKLSRSVSFQVASRGNYPSNYPQNLNRQPWSYSQLGGGHQSAAVTNHNAYNIYNQTGHSAAPSAIHPVGHFYNANNFPATMHTGYDNSGNRGLQHSMNRGPYVSNAIYV